MQGPAGLFSPNRPNILQDSVFFAMPPFAFQFKNQR
jgi:hypothetical protein